MRMPAFFLVLSLLLTSFYSPVSSAAERVYLLAGQSNMMGRGRTQELPASYRKTPKNVTFFYQGREHGLAQFAYFGPEVSFAHHVARAFPNDHHIIIKNAATGSTIQQWQPGQRPYEGLLRQLDLYFKDARPEVDAIIWMQGESDARKPDLAKQYATRLQSLLDNLRKDTNSLSSLFILGQISQNVESFPQVEQVRDVQQRFSAQHPRVSMISTDGLGKIHDHIHYNAQGQMELGKRFAEAYIHQAKR